MNDMAVPCQSGSVIPVLSLAVAILTAFFWSDHGLDRHTTTDCGNGTGSMDEREFREKVAAFLTAYDLWPDIATYITDNPEMERRGEVHLSTGIETWRTLTGRATRRRGDQVRGGSLPQGGRGRRWLAVPVVMNRL